MPARAYFGIAKLPHQSRFNRAAQLRRHGLHAITNSQHRHAQLEHDLRCACGIDFCDRGVATGENNAFRRERANLGLIHVKRMQFAVHAGFAHTARNQLCDLRAKIEDENFIVHERSIKSPRVG